MKQTFNMLSLSGDKQADSIDSLNTTFRYSNGILYRNDNYFYNMVCQTYYSELQLNKTNTSDTKTSFLIFYSFQNL